ncbi:LIM and SH3 domain protein 1-like [Xenia sp. Carnegie-2017]|uniref:LIM and SH3 domain protein 1-like n=1 Tax=Xenia sp. Carnegie-2017 TaxID=2897299 RepID=UPI001F036CB5|nr:LIM and SH3 domain protein 1-like [Xenia sp. Carnegie-2017]
MNPRCCRCDKIVYPVEKLNCLDKTWHKKCFTCQVCNMKLTMKNYKGYNKYPYCNTHYPTTKFTQIADTPENVRLSKNTKNQSQVEYHKKFEEEKGQFTAVPDDPSTQRAKRAMLQQSNAAYTRHTQVDETRAYPENAPVRENFNPQPPSHHVPAPVHNVPAPAQPNPPVPPPSSLGPRYRAMYDYTAADDDEITIREGDIIVDGVDIDAGWMEGRNERTGAFGMLPSNYVEKM